jgi:hypothetical protein
MSKAQQFLEMAVPLQKHKDLVYYHGTADSKAAKNIFRKGVMPDAIVRKGFLKPVTGKVYITSSIAYALIYALGGDMAGSKSSTYLIDRYGRYGYVFVIKGADLKDIQPDEDSIGEMISKVDWLNSLAQQHLTPNIYKRAMEDEYMYWAKAGKKLVDLMSDDQKLALIDAGAHIAHTGGLIPTEVWQVDRKKLAEFKRDGSNFFDIATKDSL